MRGTQALREFLGRKSSRIRVAAIIVILLASILVGATLAAATFGPAPRSVLTVAGSSAGCSVVVKKENQADNAVQSAINTYPGGTICLDKGSFPEQLVISASGTTLKGVGDAKTIIDPSSLVANTYDYDSGLPAAAIILVEGPSGTPTSGVMGVTVENLQVNGVAGQSFFTGCGQNYIGVDFQASSGTLSDANVTGIELPPALFGCQDGLGVYAYNGYYSYAGSNNVPDTVTISHTLVNQYDKNGITCDDPQETCQLTSDTVTGLGAIDTIAQNGIQIAYGAEATLSSNHVSGNGVYTGPGGCSGDVQGNNENCTGNEGAGILLYDAASGTTVLSNTVSLCEFGIYSYDDGNAANGYAGPETITIDSNKVDSSLAYGIVAVGAPGGGDTIRIGLNTVDNEASENPTSGVWGAPGILVDTGNFTLWNDKIEGSSTATGSSNGASQEVCGPANVAYYCASAQNISTAAIQGTSESASNPTLISLSGIVYKQDSNELATLGVLGGAVTVT